MGEGLRKIAELLAPGAYLFCIQSEMIRISEHLVKIEPCFVNLSCSGETFSIPECANTECTFITAKAIRCGGIDAVAIHDGIGNKLTFNCVEMGSPSRICWADESE